MASNTLEALEPLRNPRRGIPRPEASIGRLRIGASRVQLLAIRNAPLTQSRVLRRLVASLVVC